MIFPSCNCLGVSLSDRGFQLYSGFNCQISSIHDSYKLKRSWSWTVLPSGLRDTAHDSLWYWLMDCGAAPTCTIAVWEYCQFESPYVAEHSGAMSHGDLFLRAAGLVKVQQQRHDLLTWHNTTIFPFLCWRNTCCGHRNAHMPMLVQPHPKSCTLAWRCAATSSRAHAQQLCALDEIAADLHANLQLCG